jgi:fluoride exporter
MLVQRLILIGLGGLVGTLCRYGLSSLVDKRVGATFPTGTLLVNVIGCFLAGFLFFAFTEKVVVSDIVKTAVMIGFLGGFTTFSAFGLQTFTLFKDGEMFAAMLNVVLSNVAGLLTVWVGYSLARWIWI